MVVKTLISILVLYIELI